MEHVASTAILGLSLGRLNHGKLSYRPAQRFAARPTALNVLQNSKKLEDTYGPSGSAL
jgi:hypothetical protein